MYLGFFHHSLPISQLDAHYLPLWGRECVITVAAEFQAKKLKQSFMADFKVTEETL